MSFVEVETPKGPSRPVLKIKIPEFAEDKRFHNAKKWAPQQNQGSQTYALDLLEWEMLAMVVPNRLNNAISRLGRASLSNPSKIQELTELFVDDVWGQLSEDQRALMDKTPKSERELLNDEAAELIQAHLSTQGS